MQFNKLPILILSTPRTGSTALLKYIQKQCSVDTEIFMEPTTGNWQPDSTDWQTGEEMDRFVKIASNTSNFIVKDHIHTFYKHSLQHQHLLLSTATFKIRLQRRNFAEQVASRYIVWCRKEWHYTVDKVDKTIYNVPIRSDVIWQIAITLRKINQQLEHTNIQFDLDLFYEDLCSLFDLDSTGFLETPKPANYEDLVNYIRVICTLP